MKIYLLIIVVEGVPQRHPLFYFILSPKGRVGQKEVNQWDE
jgi:hypothetical protein